MSLSANRIHFAGTCARTELAGYLSLEICERIRRPAKDGWIEIIVKGMQL
jgi:hypothetical protein